MFSSFGAYNREAEVIISKLYDEIKDTKITPSPTPLQSSPTNQIASDEKDRKPSTTPQSIHVDNNKQEDPLLNILKEKYKTFQVKGILNEQKSRDISKVEFSFRSISQLEEFTNDNLETNQYSDKRIFQIKNLFDGKDDEKKEWRTLIVGRPDVGKSTMCQFIAHQWADSKLYQEQQFKYLFFIPLISLTTSFSEQQKDITLKEIIQHEFFKNNNELSNIANLLKSNHCLFLLDGYDEIAPFFRKKGYSYLTNIFTKLLENKFVILTSRFYSSLANVTGNFNKIFENVGFTHLNIINFIENYFPNEEKSKKDKVLEYVTKKAIGENTRIPSILLLMVENWEKEERTQSIEQKNGRVSKKTNSAQMYQKITCELIKKRLKDMEEFKDRDDIEDMMDAQLINLVPAEINFLRKKAFFAIQEGAREITLQLEENDKEVKKFNKERLLKLGFIIPITNGTKNSEFYKFTPSSFQEFFAAKYIYNLLTANKEKKQQEGMDIISQYKYFPRFKQTLIFIAGLLQGKQSLYQKFRKVLEDSPSESYDLVGSYHSSLLDSFSREFKQGDKKEDKSEQHVVKEDSSNISSDEYNNFLSEFLKFVYAYYKESKKLPSNYTLEQFKERAMENSSLNNKGYFSLNDLLICIEILKGELRSENFMDRKQACQAILRLAKVYSSHSSIANIANQPLLGSEVNEIGDRLKKFLLQVEKEVKDKKSVTGFLNDSDAIEKLNVLLSNSQLHSELGDLMIKIINYIKNDTPINFFEELKFKFFKELNAEVSPLLPMVRQYDGGPAMLKAHAFKELPKKLKEINSQLGNSLEINDDNLQYNISNLIDEIIKSEEKDEAHKKIVFSFLDKIVTNEKLKKLTLPVRPVLTLLIELNDNVGILNEIKEKNDTLQIAIENLEQLISKSDLITWNSENVRKVFFLLKHSDTQIRKKTCELLNYIWIEVKDDNIKKEIISNLCVCLSDINNWVVTTAAIVLEKVVNTINFLDIDKLVLESLYKARSNWVVPGILSRLTFNKWFEYCLSEQNPIDFSKFLAVGALAYNFAINVDISESGELKQIKIWRDKDKIKENKEETSNSQELKANKVDSLKVDKFIRCLQQQAKGKKVHDDIISRLIKKEANDWIADLESMHSLQQEIAKLKRDGKFLEESKKEPHKKILQDKKENLEQLRNELEKKIATDKYDSRSQIKISYVAELLSRATESKDDKKIEGNDIAKIHLFWKALLAQPLDISGPAHLGLVLRCFEAAKCDKRIPFRNVIIQDIQQWINVINTPEANNILWWLLQLLSEHPNTMKEIKGLNPKSQQKELKAFNLVESLSSYLKINDKDNDAYKMAKEIAENTLQCGAGIVISKEGQEYEMRINEGQNKLIRAATVDQAIILREAVAESNVALKLSPPSLTYSSLVDDWSESNDNQTHMLQYAYAKQAVKLKLNYENDACKKAPHDILCAALKTLDHERLQYLDLSDNRLTDEVAATLAIRYIAKGKWSRLRTLKLSNNSLSLNGLCYLLQELSEKSSLKFLDVDQNRISCIAEKFRTKLNPLIEKAALERLDLSLNFIDKGELVEDKGGRLVQDKKITEETIKKEKRLCIKSYLSHSFIAQSNPRVIKSLLNPELELSSSHGVIALMANKTSSILGKEHAFLALEYLHSFGQRSIIIGELFYNKEAKRIIISLHYRTPQYLLKRIKGQGEVSSSSSEKQKEQKKTNEDDENEQVYKRTGKFQKDTIKKVIKAMIKSRDEKDFYNYGVTFVSGKNELNCIKWARKMLKQGAGIPFPKEWLNIPSRQVKK